MECVPGDVIFEILVRVPAQDVLNSARLVCRKWHNIIRTRNFKRAHLHQSPCGLVAHRVDFNCCHQHITFIANASKSDDDLIEIFKLSYRPEQLVLSSCNGLILAARYFLSFYITNPITNKKLDLPPLFSNGIAHYAAAIAYVATTMEYKVVRPFIHRDCKLESQDDCVAILTVGVDKDWTCRVSTQHLSIQAKKLLTMLHPMTTQGFVHWARDEGKLTWAGYKRLYGHVLTLNVETEIITQFAVPSLRPPSHDKIGVCAEVIYLPMGSYLSLLVLRSEFSWELWEMKPETGEWTEMPSIELPEDEFVVRNCDEIKVKPVGWLRPREVLVFSVRNSFDSYFAFAVRTRKLQKFTLDSVINSFFVHRNSLVWINGC